MELYRACIAQSILHKDRIAQTTFYRFIREYDLLSKNDVTRNKRRLAFAMQYANQLWQADTLFGPYIKDKSKGSLQAKLIAFEDDASRVACHGEFFTNDDTESLISCFRSALYKRGIPDCLFVDHGSNYSSLELKLVCDRIGTILKFTPVRDGSAKGKVERTIGFMNANFWPVVHDNLWDLDVLNEALQNWSNRICERELRDFRQTRNERFEHEKKHFIPLPRTHYDCRDVYEVGVSRETLILFETNRYSVPPEYIGETVTLKVDPVDMIAEVLAGHSSTSVTLNMYMHDEILPGDIQSIAIQ